MSDGYPWCGGFPVCLQREIKALREQYDDLKQDYKRVCEKVEALRRYRSIVEGLDSAQKENPSIVDDGFQNVKEG